jgi:hypothetical protein
MYPLPQRFIPFKNEKSVSKKLVHLKFVGEHFTIIDEDIIGP